MPHAEHTVTINRPARDVFDYLADGTHNRDWRSGVLEIEKITPAEGRVPATGRSSPGRAAGAFKVTTA